MSVQSLIKKSELTSDKTVLEVVNLSFRYSRRHPLVLRDISVNFSEKCLTVIAGPNGSGKTTLIKHFNGLYVPQQGEVLVFGEKITKRSRREIQSRVGMVFQNPDEQIFFPKVWDDVAFGPKNLRLPWEEIEERVDVALNEVQITNLRDRVTFNLSFGEKKKVAFAGILAMQPEIVVLDEPTIGIDPWVKPRLIEIIRSFTPKRTVIVITHDFDMMKHADRIILLKKGRVEGDFSTVNEFIRQEFPNY